MGSNPSREEGRDDARFVFSPVFPEISYRSLAVISQADALTAEEPDAAAAAVGMEVVVAVAVVVPVGK